MKQEAVYVGIDVSKSCVDVAVRPTDQTWTISNDEPGIQELVSRLKNPGPRHSGAGCQGRSKNMPARCCCLAIMSLLIAKGICPIQRGPAGSQRSCCSA